LGRGKAECSGWLAIMARRRRRKQEVGLAARFG
jgi:hypothetical protein